MYRLADEKGREAAMHKRPIPPYSRLAELYYDYSSAFGPRYDNYLSTLSGCYAFPIDDVLEIACGAGTLTVRLARQFRSVTAFDINDGMLECARRACSGFPNVRFSRADFQSFDFSARFDAVVCASDSLNYLARPEDLAIVMKQVADQLRPGGFFLFDALDANALRRQARVDLRYEVNGTPFAMCSEFDEQLSRDTTRVIFADEVEEHVRVAIEAEHVARAASQTGLALLESFADSAGFRRFYVLRRPAQ